MPETKAPPVRVAAGDTVQLSVNVLGVKPSPIPGIPADQQPYWPHPFDTIGQIVNPDDPDKPGQTVNFNRAMCTKS